MKFYTMLDATRYPQYFGFTEKEINNLLTQARLSQKAHELKEMYNRYQIEGTTPYNPFSIVNFIDEAITYEPQDVVQALQTLLGQLSQS